MFEGFAVEHVDVGAAILRVRHGGIGPRSPTSWAPDRALAFHMLWRHYGVMTSIQIKDVPEETHAVLRSRAAQAHQSLQEYLRTRLIEEASRPTVSEVMARAGGRAGGSVSFEEAVRALRDDRDRR